jgi:hypothetical protein
MVGQTRRLGVGIMGRLGPFLLELRKFYSSTSPSSAVVGRYANLMTEDLSAVHIELDSST